MNQNASNLTPYHGKQFNLPLSNLQRHYNAQVLYSIQMSSVHKHSILAYFLKYVCMCMNTTVTSLLIMEGAAPNPANIVAAMLGFVILAWHRRSSGSTHKLPLPPGPKKLPLLGNILVPLFFLRVGIHLELTWFTYRTCPLVFSGLQFPNRDVSGRRILLLQILP